MSGKNRIYEMESYRQFIDLEKIAFVDHVDDSHGNLAGEFTFAITMDHIRVGVWFETLCAAKGAREQLISAWKEYRQEGTN